MQAAKKYPDIEAYPYLAHTLCKNSCLQAFDRLLPIKNSLSDRDIYTLFLILTQVWSKNSRYETGIEVPYLADMFQRLNFLISRDRVASTTDTWDQLLSQVIDAEFARLIYSESLALTCSLGQVSAEQVATLKSLQQSFQLSADDLQRLCTRVYLDGGLRAAEDNLQAALVSQKGASLIQHPSQINLVQMNLLPESSLMKSCGEFLESFESAVLPPEATAEIRVAILALVGHAVRVDNTVDVKEKEFQAVITRELGITDEDTKRYPYHLKSATVEELCSTIKKWSMANSRPAALRATAGYLLRALGSDGVVEIREEKFKTRIMQQLNIDSQQWARLLIKLQLC